MGEAKSVLFLESRSNEKDDRTLTRFKLIYLPDKSCSFLINKMGGSASLTQLYQLPENIDFQTFMTITRFKFTPESYDIFADRDGQISRQRMIEIVAARDCYFSYEWGFDAKARSVPNRVQQIIDYLTSQGLYIYTEDGQYRHNVQMGEMSLKERIKQSLVTSQCMILCLMERYYQKLMDSGESTPANSKKENQIQIEFHEFIALKGVRYIIPIFLEEKGKITTENTPKLVYDLLSTKYCINMTEFEYNPQQLENLYSIIVKTIKPLREGGNFVRSDLEYAVSNEGKHYHWLTERFNLEEYNLSVSENDSFKKEISKRNSMNNILTSAEMNKLVLKNAAKRRQTSNDDETQKLLSNMKNVSKMTISRDLLKKYAKIFADNNFETTTRILPLLQANDEYLLEIGIEKVHSQYLRQQILLDVKENFDSSYVGRIDAILSDKKNFYSKEDEERQRVLQQQIEASSRMKELSLMAFEDHLSYCYEEYCEMIVTQELFHQKRQLLLQQIDEENQKHTFLMISCQQSYERRKFDELQQYRRERFERIVNGRNIMEVLSNFRETLQRISEITLTLDNSRESLNPLESTLRGNKGATFGGNGTEVPQRSSSIFPYGPPTPLSPKKGMTVDTSFLSPKKSPKNLKARSMSQLAASTISTAYSPSTSALQVDLLPSSKKLVPYGLTQPQAVQPDINATRDPEELSYLLQETVYIFKRMELHVLNSIDHVTFLLENSIIKLLITFISQQYIHCITFTSTHFLTDSHFFQLSLPHQPLLLLSHCIRCRTDYNAMHSSLVYLLHRYGILSLLFEMMKWYVEKIDVLAICLYVIDLIITTKEHSVLLSYLAPYLSVPATQQEQGRMRGKSTSPSKKASSLARNLLSMNPNEFYLLFLMILLEKYYYHADGSFEGNDEFDDDLKQEIIYKTPSKRNSRDHAGENKIVPVRPSSPVRSPRTAAGTTYLISSPSSGRKSPRSGPGSPRTIRTSPASPKALLPHLDRQVHLLYEKDYKEMLLMVCAIFSQLASVEKYDSLLIKCREKLVTNLINEVISIPITNFQCPDEYYYNFLFSLESLYYTKFIAFLPQNPVDSFFRLGEKYGIYDCTISYALKPDSYSLSMSILQEKKGFNYRKLSENMILQLHEFVLIKYLINTFHYYCYHHEYQSIEMVIQIIRVIGNVIYCRNDLKKICYEYFLHKELIYLLRVGLQMLKYQVTSSTATSASAPGGQGFSSRDILKDVHVIIQEEDRERRKETNQSFLRNTSGKTPTSFLARMKKQFPEAMSNDLEEMSQATSQSPSATYSPSTTSKKVTMKENDPTTPSSKYGPHSEGFVSPSNWNKSLRIDTNPSSMKSTAYSEANKINPGDENHSKYINQTRLLAIQLLIETMQTFTNLIVVDTSPSPLMQPHNLCANEPPKPPSNEMKAVLQILQDSYKDCMEKYNLGEVLMEIFLYLNFDSQLIYSYLLFLHKLTQKGNYPVMSRLVALGFVEKVKFSILLYSNI